MKFGRGRLITGILMMLMLSFMVIAAPTMALAAESGPLAVDSLLHKLGQTNFAAWFQLAVLAFGAATILRRQYHADVRDGHMGRLEFIARAVPFIHGQVQRMKGTNKSIDKGLAFIEQMSAYLRSSGLAEIRSHEVESVKALGSGEHQRFKAVRDAGIVINGDISPLPLEGSSATSNNAPAPSDLESSPLDQWSVLDPSGEKELRES